MQPINSRPYSHNYSSRPQIISYSPNRGQYQNVRYNVPSYPNYININQIPQPYSGIRTINQTNYYTQNAPYYQTSPLKQPPQINYGRSQYNSSYQQLKPVQRSSSQEKQFMSSPYQPANLVRWNDKNESRMEISQQNIIPNIGFTNPTFENQILYGNNALQKGKDENYFKKTFPDPYIKYKILSVMDAKKALDVTSVTDPDKKLRKGDAIIWEYHGGPNQNFYIKSMGNNKFKFINAATGFPLKVQDSSKADGAIVKSNPNTQTQNEIFALIKHEGKYKKQHIYQIETFCGKVLDCEDQHSRNGTNIIQWASNKGKNQLWLIQPA